MQGSPSRPTRPRPASQSRGKPLAAPARRAPVHPASKKATKPPRRIKPKWGRIFLVLLGIVGLVGFTGLACGLYFSDSLDKRIHRVDAFDEVTGGRPAKLVDGAMNILIIGSDARADGEDPGVVGERADSLMIAHLSRDHKQAQLVSIPRDTWVYIPSNGKGHGGEEAKINAAHAWGGIPLTVKTVERFTGVKIDHVLKINFAGFRRMTDTLGGVDVTVAQTVTDPRSKRTFHQGVNHLDGAAALDYVRQRYGLPRGDFDRVHRQQIFLRALLTKATDSGTLTNPGKLKSFLEATADSVTADRKFSIADTAVQLRKMRAGDITFVTMPVAGTEKRSGQSVVMPNRQASNDLFRAVARDNVADWLKSNPQNDPLTGR